MEFRKEAYQELRELVGVPKRNSEKGLPGGQRIFEVPQMNSCQTFSEKP